MKAGVEDTCEEGLEVAEEAIEGQQSRIAWSPKILATYELSHQSLDLYGIQAFLCQKSPLLCRFLIAQSRGVQECTSSLEECKAVIPIGT